MHERQTIHLLSPASSPSGDHGVHPTPLHVEQRAFSGMCRSLCAITGAYPAVRRPRGAPADAASSRRRGSGARHQNGLVASRAQYETDCCRIALLALKFVDGIEVEVHLAGELRLEVLDLQVDDNKAPQPVVVEQQVEEELGLLAAAPSLIDFQPPTPSLYDDDLRRTINAGERGAWRSTTTVITVRHSHARATSACTSASVLSNRCSRPCSVSRTKPQKSPKRS
jgi:hypothetical protein